MRKLRIVPYKMGSRSARLLAEELSKRLGYKVWRGSPKVGEINICWGYKGRVSALDLEKFVNHPDLIVSATDKRLAFQAMEKAGVSHVPYTTSKEVAQGWSKEGAVVFARTAGGQGGSGIHIVQPGEEVPTQPLYTKYIKKRKELRVHVLNNEVLDVQEKRKKKGEDADPLVRSHGRGWIFARSDIVEPAGLRDLAIAAVRAVGLDFGAVDIIWNESQNKCYVLEINSAPGIEGTSLERYADAFSKIV